MTFDVDSAALGAAPGLSGAFLSKLLTSVRLGHRLDDPRNAEVLQRWVAICKGLPDIALMDVVPATIRALLRRSDTRDAMMACGMSPGHPLQHETIAPHVISWRRYEAARGRDPANLEARQTIEILRAELRALREQFNVVFDQVAGVEQERERLSIESASLQQKLLSERLRGDEIDRRLRDAREQATRLFRLYLFSLREEHDRRSNDFRREQLVAAEIAVEAHAATLEALGFKEEADQTAQEILGPILFAEYFQDDQADPVGTRREKSKDDKDGSGG